MHGHMNIKSHEMYLTYYLEANGGVLLKKLG